MRCVWYSSVVAWCAALWYSEGGGGVAGHSHVGVVVAGWRDIATWAWWWAWGWWWWWGWWWEWCGAVYRHDVREDIADGGDEEDGEGEAREGVEDVDDQGEGDLGMVALSREQAPPAPAEGEGEGEG
jgi:hypothetical protein